MLVECSVWALTSMSLPSPWSGTSVKEEQRDCRSQRKERTREKQHLPGITRILHPWTHSICGCLYKTCTRSNLLAFQHRRVRESNCYLRNCGELWLLLKESAFFKGMAPGKFTMLQWLHTQEHMDSLNQSQWAFFYICFYKSKQI